MVNDWLAKRYSGDGCGLGGGDGQWIRWGERLLAVSDNELLRRLGQDLRSIYAEVIRQPLPPCIQATLALIDRKQRLAEQLPRMLPH
jgi:hypothetical protein